MPLSSRSPNLARYCKLSHVFSPSDFDRSTCAPVINFPCLCCCCFILLRELFSCKSYPDIPVFLNLRFEWAACVTVTCISDWGWRPPHPRGRGVVGLGVPVVTPPAAGAVVTPLIGPAPTPSPVSVCAPAVPAELCGGAPSARRSQSVHTRETSSTDRKLTGRCHSNDPIAVSIYRVLILSNFVVDPRQVDFEAVRINSELFSTFILFYRFGRLTARSITLV